MQINRIDMQGHKADGENTTVTMHLFVKVDVEELNKIYEAHVKEVEIELGDVHD